MKEIITLSFGEYSNYVNSHFWNVNLELTKASDLELDHSILYNDYGTPRGLIFDSSINIRSYYSKNDKISKKEQDSIIKTATEDK